MKKVYVLKTNHDGLIGVYTTKKRVYDRMLSLAEDLGQFPSYNKFCKEFSYIWHFEEKDNSGEYWASNTHYTVDQMILNL